jgi:hypothetical protein
MPTRRRGKAQKKGNKPGPAYAYNVKALREQRMDIARRAKQAYEQFVAPWQTRLRVRGRSKSAGL